MMTRSRFSINRSLAKLIAALTVVGLVTSSCGGGSSSGTPAPNPPPPATTLPMAPSAAVSFTNITASTGMSHQWGIVGATEPSDPEFFAGGAAAGDFDNDGDIDIYLSAGNLDGTKLYRNDGGNRFTDIAEQARVRLNQRTSGATFADIDGDGHLDLFVGAVEGDPIRVFRNNADGTFESMTERTGISLFAMQTVSAAFGDYDLDGDLDMAIAHWGNLPNADTESLWRNTGGMIFESISMASGIAESIVVLNNPAPVEADLDYTFTPTFADINNDGYSDLLFVADFTTTQVFMNNRDGTFDNVTTDVIIDENGMGSAVADFDHDGDLDWFVTSIYNREPNQGNIFKVGNRLYENNGDGTFTDNTVDRGVDNGGWGWGACFADFNNDGHPDIFHTNGWRDGRDPANDYTQDQSRLFISDGQGEFVNRADQAGITDRGQGRGVVCFDSDRDGDIDILVTNNDDESLIFYRNDSDNGNHFIEIRLAGFEPNTQGVGSKVYLTAGGVTQMQEIRVGSNFASQNPAEAHFGLGSSEAIDRIRVVWPDQQETVLENLPADQFLVIEQT